MTAAETHSFARAQALLAVVGEIEISSRQINRIAECVGQRLLDQQRERSAQHANKQLPVEVENIPPLAVVEVDGGRIRTRKEQQGCGTHHPAWRESKTALFMRMSSEVSDKDPADDLPSSLLSRRHVRRLVQEMSGLAPAVEQDAHEEQPPQTLSSSGYQPPRRLMRTCLSSIDDSNTFGKLMAAEAYRKGFFQAPRKAFVADGMKCNWSIWKKHFQWQGFIPIVDFIHVLSYLYKAAIAIGESEEFGWGLCVEWSTACWQGRVTDVLAELAEWIEQQQPSPPDTNVLSDDDPRRIVGRAITYLTNNTKRMDYPRYRRLGLPVTSALMESLIKELNYRVKGSEKFWNDPSGANHILALRAASLSDDSRLNKSIR